jgi:hypothetical protein
MRISEGKAMFRQFLTGACLLAALDGCVAGPHTQNNVATAATQDSRQQSSCVTDAGPRLPSSSSQCAGYGNTYSGKDLQQTGHENVAPALQTLDPSITIQH